MKWILIVVAILAGLVAVAALVGSLLPRDHVASRSVRLRQSREAVWQAITDYAGAASWRPSLRSVERAPDQDGHAVWKEIDRHGEAMPLATIEEAPPTRLVRKIADPGLPFDGTWTYEVVPDGEGCRITITERGEVKHALFRFVGRFVLGYTSTIDTYLKALGRKFGEDVVPS